MSLDRERPSVPGGDYPLGHHPVARVGFGAMQLERLHHSEADAVAIVHRALELGINHFDTAEFYGNGSVNRVLHKAIGHNSEIVIASKVGAAPNPGGERPLRPAQRPEELREAVEANLTSLGIAQIPLVNLRRLDVGPGIAAEGDQVVDMDDQLEVMIRMRSEGKIGSIGVSAVTLDGVKRAMRAGIVCVQNAYSVISRQFEDMLEFCRENALAWVPFFPLGSAFAHLPKVQDRPVVGEIADRLGVKPSQVALAWLLAHAPNVLIIPGTADLAHLEENVSVAQLVLDSATTAQLDALGAASTVANHIPPVWNH